MPEAKPRRRWRRVLRWIAVAFIGLLTTGVIYEQIMRWRVHYTHPPRGELVAVDGRKVNVRHEGKDLDGPTVVFEAGVGTPGTANWGKVRPRVSKFAPVLCYDRAGLGWSEPSANNDRTSAQLAKELHALLHEVDAKPPYLLVGHSMGGHHVRAFASQFPHLVAGMVLIDVPEGSESEYPPRPGNIISDPPMFAEPVFRIAAITGVLRLMMGNRLGEVRGPQTLSVQAREAKAMVPSFEQGKGFDGPGSKPLVVIPGRKPFEGPYLVTDEQRFELQRKLLLLSSNSQLIVAENSGHTVHYDEPELVINAIRDVWNASRDGTPLGGQNSSVNDSEP